MNDNSLENQKIASNPQFSVWVSASAGTGKTTVLVSRLLRLFLSNIEPSKILCLTYTNAGAVEMQDRIFKFARHFATTDDVSLREDIKKLFENEGNDLTNEELNKYCINARKLFPLLIDSPLPLKIYTIHAFCQSILKRFPIEAGISPHFNIIDEIDTQILLKTSYKELLSRIRKSSTKNDVKLGLSYDLLTSNLDASGFEKLVGNIIFHREKFLKLLDIYGDIESIEKKLKNKIFKGFDFAIDDFIKNPYLYKQNVISKIPTEILNKTRDILFDSQQPTMQKLYFSLTSFLSTKTDAEKLNLFDDYISIFLTDKGTPRTKLFTKEYQQSHPDIYNKIVDEADRIKQALDFIKMAQVFNLSLASITISIELINTYNKIKSQKNQMDFFDLIKIVERLFKKPNISEWILYKMDGGISHILIDESQDTSQLQWDIIDILSEEFFSSGRTNSDMKSLFFVGDSKQSIFSFQGANVAVFDKYKNHFKSRTEKGDFEFKDIPLNRSFRSCKNILSLVDMVSKNTIPDYDVVHIPHRKDFDGYVEFLPLVKSIPDVENDFQKPPMETIDIQNVRINLSDIIANKIKYILENDYIMDKGITRKVEPKDIMILVQKRKNSDYLIDKLNKYNIPTSGRDKLDLSGNIVVLDLISLIKFTLSPYDDLSLCEVLKSPLYNLNDDDLFKLCYNRRDKTVFDILSLQPEEKYNKIYQSLLILIDMSRYKKPFEFFDYVLKVEGKTKNFIARFGSEVSDILNEFIGKLLHYDRIIVGKSLTDFYDWFTKSKIEIKRDLENTNNNVRILTVHGAKGLESPIIFLFDSNIPLNQMDNKILWSDDDLPFYKTTGFNEVNDTLKSIAEYQKDSMTKEFYRLLYVALTRARDQLYIAGWENKKGDDSITWYGIIKQVFKTNLENNNPDFHIVDDEILIQKTTEIIESKVQTIGQKLPKNTTEDASSINKDFKPQLPDFIFKPINPIRQDIINKVKHAISPLDKLGDNLNPLSKGTIIHKLIERLKFIPKDEYEQIIKNYLSFNKVDDAEILTKNIITIFNDKRFSTFLDGEVLNEVELLFNEGDQLINVRIDTLVIVKDKIYIIDYKTDSNPDIKKPPANYISQLNIYKSGIQKLYPSKDVQTIIIWLAIPDISIIS